MPTWPQEELDAHAAWLDEQMATSDMEPIEEPHWDLIDHYGERQPFN